MDRNLGIWTLKQIPLVALRKESVDRNVKWQQGEVSYGVALRKESVDRNTMRRDFKALGLLSLSARRAWIEMKPLPRPLPIGASRPPQGERG